VNFLFNRVAGEIRNALTSKSDEKRIRRKQLPLVLKAFVILLDLFAVLVRCWKFGISEFAEMLSLEMIICGNGYQKAVWKCFRYSTPSHAVSFFFGRMICFRIAQNHRNYYYS
jgi:hypothetical protein